VLTVSQIIPNNSIFKNIMSSINWIIRFLTPNGQRKKSWCSSRDFKSTQFNYIGTASAIGSKSLNSLAQGKPENKSKNTIQNIFWKLTALFPYLLFYFRIRKFYQRGKTKMASSLEKSDSLLPSELLRRQRRTSILPVINIVK
jgi:hypothetical protein